MQENKPKIDAGYFMRDIIFPGIDIVSDKWYLRFITKEHGIINLVCMGLVIPESGRDYTLMKFEDADYLVKTYVNRSSQFVYIEYNHVTRKFIRLFYRDETSSKVASDQSIGISDLNQIHLEQVSLVAEKCFNFRADLTNIVNLDNVKPISLRN